MKKHKKNLYFLNDFYIEIFPDHFFPNKLFREKIEKFRNGSFRVQIIMNFTVAILFLLLS